MLSLIFHELDDIVNYGKLLIICVLIIQFVDYLYNFFL